MKIVSPARPLVRRSRTLLVLAGVLLSLGVFLVLVGIAMAAIPWVAPESSAYSLFTFMRGLVFVGGIALALAALAVAVRAVTLRTENTDAVVTARELARHLDDRFTFFTNVNRPGLGYIDGVLVGPPGALVCRILDSKGLFFNEASGWLKGGPNGTPLRTNPTQQAIDDIKALREYLAKNQLERLPVFGVIVFIHPDPVLRLVVKDPVVPPTHLSSLMIRLQDNYLAKDRTDNQTIEAVNKLLQIR